MLNRFSLLLSCASLLCPGVRGQEAVSGISIPVTMSGDARAVGTTHADDNVSPNAAGFRFVISPTLKLGAHWFGYSALDVHSSKYFSYQNGPEQDRPVPFGADAGFRWIRDDSFKSITAHKGRPAQFCVRNISAEYDDAKMPLLMRRRCIPVICPYGRISFRVESKIFCGRRTGRH